MVARWGRGVDTGTAKSITHTINSKVRNILKLPPSNGTYFDQHNQACLPKASLLLRQLSSSYYLLDLAD